MVAELAGVGLVDATQADLGSTGVSWCDLHRKVDPRPPLTCPGCGGRVHAKVSPAPARLRFFAHDATPDTLCPLAGESAAHRALKTLLAAAVREAGWAAQLEVPGEGWRADVLATSPSGARRIAWEAQLSGVAVDEVVRRTGALQRSNNEVCWVATRRVAWLGWAPAVQVDTGSGGSGRGMTVEAGLQRFAQRWCEPRTRCRAWRSFMHDRMWLPCHGHGRWQRVRDVSLARFVRLVCEGSVVHHVRQSGWDDRGGREGAGVWTAPHYVRAEKTQLDASALPVDHSADGYDAQRHEQQQYLRSAVDTYIVQTHGRQPEIARHCGPSREHGDGIPVHLDGVLVAVIAPKASAVNFIPRTATVIYDNEPDAAQARLWSRYEHEVVVVPTPSRSH